MKNNENVVIFPPCGENVGLPTKRGANKVNPILPLLPRLSAVLPPQGREITTRGFTLIELLVVVLIISILAAVAVPQYQKAVVKSKYMSLKPLVRSAVDAQRRYYLENGKYASYFEDLDIALPTPTSSFFQANSHYYQYPWGQLIIDTASAVGFVNTNFRIRYEMYFDGKQQCMVDKTYKIGQEICKADSGRTSPSQTYGTNDIYYWY